MCLSPWIDSASKRNEYQVYFLRGKKRPVLTAKDLATLMYLLSRNSGSLNLLEVLGPVQTCNGLEFFKNNKPNLFVHYVCNKNPVPVTARSKAQVCGRSPAEIVGSNPTGSMDVCLL